MAPGDVVAPGPGWTVPPFAGLVRDGRLWGRGALDDKSLGIAQLAALIDLTRRKVALERDVVFLAVADEESGSLRGTAWLLAAHPEIFQGVEAVMGEGGRSQLSGERRLLWWGIEVAQKRALWLEVATSGRGVQGLARVLALPLHWRVTGPARDYLKGIAPLHNDHWRRILSNIDQIVDEKTGPKEFLLPGMSSLFLDTVQVTVLAGGERINVVPARSLARIDVRLLPDTDSAAFLATLKKALGPDFDVKVLVTSPPAPPSPTAGRFYSVLRTVLGKEAPVVPTVIAGVTDARFFRERGIPAYGVSPFALGGEDSGGIHGVDERIPLAELDRGIERTRRLITAYAAPVARH